jgi:Ca2+-transporting ATPase
MTDSDAPVKNLWHTLSTVEVISRLAADPKQGLSTQQVKERQQQYGLNELTATQGRSQWQAFLDQFTNIMLLMLLGVAIISAILDLTSSMFPKDALAILAIVLLNGILGYVQESQAEKALAALKQLSPPQVKVKRNGLLQELPAPELVPGDLVFLDTGAQIPADGRLIEAVNLQIREAALTGEAMPVIKNPEAQLSEDTPLGDRSTMAFQGTEVVQGRGQMVVTHTGMMTELGKVASLLGSVESEPTPLQKRMDQLGNVLVSGSLTLVTFVVIAGLLQAGSWSPLKELVSISLSMAVAVVPEGLPAVITVTLAIGTQRMVQRQALIRRLPAVETLGSVTTICSDKTGTLTENKMVVTDLKTATVEVKVTGTGYIPEGDFYTQGRALDPGQSPEISALLVAVVYCNDSTLQLTNATWSIIGDPTEAALLVLAGKANLFKEDLEKQLHRKAEIPFSSERKRMTVILASSHPENASTPYVLFSKGSPEIILEHCNRILVQEDIQPLTPDQRQTILAANETLASQGIRVLGVATEGLSELGNAHPLETLESNLVWLGLVGMRDAPRKEARQAVIKCKEAGIRPMMITGDHRLTAIAVAQDLGIIDPGEEAIEGRVLAQMPPEAFIETTKRVNVYARVAPEHKLQIVQALQKQNQFVAMTGDGVNDSPALKQADIGIAMGITGTDVSKEASDMVLLNDNFATIVDAIEEGRIVYSNIRRFIKYILGSNIGEVLTIAAAPFLGVGGVPLTPLQILWMNLVTDGVPALALALEPAEAGIMQAPPIPPNESIFARGMGSYMVRVGIIFALITITMMAIVGAVFPHWKTMVFTTLCVAQMGHALAVRSDTRLAIQLPVKTNPYLYWAVGITTLLQLSLLYVPILRNILGTEALSLEELGICFGFSALLFVWIEVEKIFLAGYARWQLGKSR